MEVQVPEILPETFQVFINHRGPDVKKTLASLIYHRLINCGLRVFLDRDEIRTGDSITLAISTAIQSASLHIAIFSETYAESSWCLDEVYWIMRSHHKRNTKVIPVFFDVQPTDLRYIESGRYAKAFENHQLKGRVTIEVIQNWKRALNEASHISGLLFKTKESDLGELLEKIVKIVVQEILQAEPLEVGKYSVGLHQAAEDFQNEIKNQRDPVTVMGITGMIGVGKSTLARYLYGLKCSGFTRSCFLCDVRKRDLLSLQNKLLFDLLGDRLNHIDNIYKGRSILRNCIRRLPRIFVVLDDVDHMDQIDGLLDTDDLPSGSLILITSRDKDLLRRSSSRTIVYYVKPLHKIHARELFCRHAFSESKASEEFEGLIEEILKICEGLPLTLKVLGGLFLGQSVEYWKWQLDKLSTTLLSDVINPLKVCYEALDPVEKEVFLDIGCFLVGEERELAVRVLEGLYENNRIVGYLESLRQKCLVDVHGDEYGSVKITVHNQLRDLARHIAREELRALSTLQPLRLSSSDDVRQMLQLQAGSHIRIRGIRSSETSWGFELVNNKTEVEGMHLFVIEHSYDLSTILDKWDISGDLVWLRLRKVLSCHLPPSISLRRLRVLEIEGKGKNFQALFNSFDDDPPSHLSEMSIDGITMRDTAPLFRFLGWKGTGVRTLTKLVLKNLAFLQSIPIEFSQLPNLRHLDLSGCSNLTALPKTFSQLLQLQYLSLRECISLSISPDILGNISTLEYVDFEGCRNLVALPLAIPYQMHLRCLNLLDTGLSELPDCLEILDHLEQLKIRSPRLTKLPICLGKLKGLTELVLDGCSALRRILPQEIEAPKIKFLTIKQSPICNFTFQDKESVLRDLSLNSTSISEICIPEGVLSSLETIDLSQNSVLMKVNALPSALVKLDLSSCPKLKTLTTLSNLANLKLIRVSNCINLETLNFGGLISLQEIEARGCWKLKRLEGLRKCGRLDRLNISTDTRTIWNDIGVLLRSPYHEKLSTASITGLADVRAMSNRNEVRCILGRFKTKMEDIVYGATGDIHFCKELVNFCSLSGILLCVLDGGYSVSSPCFRVRVTFQEGNWNNVDTDHVYETFCGGVGGRRLHIFLWTEHSNLFKDFKWHEKINAYFKYAKGIEWGQIVTVEKGEDVLEVCKEIITAFA